ncbi:MAG: XRE family transcriptional regulator [Actinophytocola sp.]|nr:XRE family transcriptional regulator [Actinophytocola sp.]
MEENRIVQKNVELQRQWYGEPLGDRVRRLVVAFDVSQAFLADVLGISAPMLSQVMSGRRAKIGNPAVLARLIMLERKILTPGVASGEQSAIDAAMEDVRESNPTVGRDTFPVHPGIDERTLLAALRDIAEDENLADAADRLEEDFPAIADLLRRAGKNSD